MQSISYKVLLTVWVVSTICFSSAAGAATLYVGGDPGDYASIQAAVAAAETGDTILIRDGAYVEAVIIDNYTTPGDSGSGSHDRSGLAIKEAPGASVSVRNPEYWGTIFEVFSNGVTIQGLDIYGPIDDYGATYTMAIHLDGADNCTIQNNRCGWDALHRNQYGIYLTGEANNNIIRNNISLYNRDVGIYLHGSDYNLITGNTCSYTRDYYHSEPGIRLYASDFNTISDNVVSHNPRGIELYYNNHYNTVTGNYCSANIHIGLYMYGNATTMISANTLTGNETGYYQTGCSNTLVAGNAAFANSDYGMYIFNSSHYNNIYLNRLSDNATANLFLGTGTDNAMAPRTKLAYHYHGSASKNFLGNFYDDYSGLDADGDGIGDTMYSGDTYEDAYPLVAAPDNYTLRTWFLSTAGMNGNDLSEDGGRCEIPAGGAVVLPADFAARTDSAFAAGSIAEETGWTYQLAVEEFSNAPSSYLTLTLGFADADGSAFTSAGGQPSVVPVSGSGNNQWLFGQFDNVQAFTVPSGRYLALRIANSHSSDAFHLFCGSIWSYVTASAPAAAYPVNGEGRGGGIIPIFPLLLQ